MVYPACDNLSKNNNGSNLKSYHGLITIVQPQHDLSKLLNAGVYHLTCSEKRHISCVMKESLFWGVPTRSNTNQA